MPDREDSFHRREQVDSKGNSRKLLVANNWSRTTKSRFYRKSDRFKYRKNAVEEEFVKRWQQSLHLHSQIRTLEYPKHSALNKLDNTRSERCIGDARNISSFIPTDFEHRGKSRVYSNDSRRQSVVHREEERPLPVARIDNSLYARDKPPGVDHVPQNAAKNQHRTNNNHPGFAPTRINFLKNENANPDFHSRRPIKARPKQQNYKRSSSSSHYNGTPCFPSSPFQPPPRLPLPPKKSTRTTSGEHLVSQEFHFDNLSPSSYRKNLNFIEEVPSLKSTRKALSGELFLSDSFNSNNIPSSQHKSANFDDEDYVGTRNGFYNDEKVKNPHQSRVATYGESIICRRSDVHASLSGSEFPTEVAGKSLRRGRLSEYASLNKSSEDFLRRSQQSPELIRGQCNFPSDKTVWLQSQKPVPSDTKQKSSPLCSNNSLLELRQLLKMEVNPGDPRPNLRHIRILGNGSTGVVSLARLKGSENFVAVKKMSLIKQQRPELLLNEAIIMRSYQHPNIVEMFDSYLIDDELWVIMEYMNCGALTGILSECRISEDQIAEISLQVLTALAYLHDYGIIHRDVKSDSILLSTKAHVKLSDFGFCAKISPECPRRRSLVGTPYWMAPEVISRTPYFTAVDIWSFGVLIVELVDGEPTLFDEPPSVAMSHIKNSVTPHLRFPQRSSAALNSFLSVILVRKDSHRATAAQLLRHPFLKLSGAQQCLLPLLRRISPHPC